MLNSSSNAIFKANPIRYRGYYYDSETGLYYLQSRYYDPTVKRFINADGYASTGQGFIGYNMFAYCCNTPVNFVDSDGEAMNTSLCVADTGCNPSKYPKNGTPKTPVVGYKNTVVVTEGQSERISRTFNPINVTVGGSTSTTVFSTGNPGSFITGYTKINTSNPNSSSMGITASIWRYTVNLNSSMDNLGISYSYTNGSMTQSVALKANLSEFKVGIEFSSIISWDSVSETSYINISADGWGIMAAFAFCFLGQIQPASVPNYATAS